MPEPDDFSVRYELRPTNHLTVLSTLSPPLLALKSNPGILRFLPSAILLTRHGISILMLLCSAALAVSCQIATITQFFESCSTKTRTAFDPVKGDWRNILHDTCFRYSGRKPHNNRRHNTCRLITKLRLTSSWFHSAERACQQASAARQANG